MTIAAQPPAALPLPPRERVSLDGTWQIRFEDAAAPAEITVPGPWSARFPERANTPGTAAYARSVTVPDHWRGRQVALRFGAVNYLAEISVNGRGIGRHEGGYLPFDVVIPDDLLAGEMGVEVRVTMPDGDRSRFADMPFDEIPHGKQSWYGLLGGIWQSVSLECRDATHIVTQKIVADLATGTVTIDAELSAPLAGALAGTVHGPDGTVAATFEIPSDGGTRLTTRLRIAAPRPWSPNDPALYRLVLELRQASRVTDAVADSFGFRSFETRDGRFYLNGEPFYLRGALDQDYYPDGICTPPSLEFLEDQARKAKQLGLNLLRCHIKVPDPRYYDVADRFGLLVWTEIPNVQSFSDRSAERLLDTMRGILRRDGNHPSIVIWTLINEDWGTRLADSADQRDWLKRAYRWLKAEDPTRLVVDNSACIPNFHVESDIDDYHYYAAVPEMAGEWSDWVRSFAGRPGWTYSPNGDAVRRGDEPLVVSEFGVWGLPDPAKLLKDGREPFWFETGMEWGRSEGVAYPHGVRDRYTNYRLDTVFPSFDTFIEATQWHQFNALKFEIEEMRRHASIQGYVITELTDVHWEANGLMDLERNPRAYHDRFHEVNADIVILAQCPRHSAWSGESVAVGLEIATGGRVIDGDAELRWSIDGRDGPPLPVGAADAATVRALPPITLQAPETVTGTVATIAFSLVRNGAVLARNRIDLPVYARRPAPRIAVHAPDADVAEFLAGLGYRLAGADEAEVRVVRTLSAKDVEAMRHGARFVVLADSAPLPFGNLRSDEPGWNYPGGGDRGQATPQIAVVEREGTIWKGNWITGFSWVKRTGPFARMPGGPLIDMSFAGVVPSRVLTGFRIVELGSLVQAGLVSGWIHKPGALIGKRHVGRGLAVATTFGLLRAAPGADPVAATLLDGLIESAVEAFGSAAGDREKVE